MTSCLFSIIIPLYNKKDYIDRGLRSIISQTFKDFEIIVIDDGSTDGSSIIVEELAAHDSRIVYKRFDNAGVSIARNRGIELAQGEFVLFIDADDWIEADYLEKINNAIFQKSADIYIWGLTKDYSDRSKVQIPVMDGVYCRQDFMSNMVEEQYGSNEGLYGYICNKAIRRDLIIKNGIKFNPQLKLQEDYDFFLECYRHAESFFCFGACGYHYIIDVAPQCQRKSGNVNYIQLYGIASKCQSIAKDNGVPLSSIERLENTCANLLISGFLEMNPVSTAKIEELFDFLSSSTEATGALSRIKTPYRVLKFLVVSKNKYLTKAYLTFWRLYLSFRQH